MAAQPGGFQIRGFLTPSEAEGMRETIQTGPREFHPHTAGWLRGSFEGWQVTAVLYLVEGRLSIGCLSLEPLPSDEPPAVAGISTATLRRLPLGRILAAAQTNLISLQEEIEARGAAPRTYSPDDLRRLEEAADAAGGPARRPGRPRLPDELLRRIARTYLDLQAQGVGRGILNRIADSEYRPRETIRDWVRQARERGFLGPGSPGRAGAMPGPRLHETEATVRTEPVGRKGRAKRPGRRKGR